MASKNASTGLTKRAGTEFQKLVWRAIKAIPRGQTRSYKQIAVHIGRPKAFRAVAAACGANPTPIIVPCHRVTGSNGYLGGYSYGGVAKKRALLRGEGVDLSQFKT